MEINRRLIVSCWISTVGCWCCGSRFVMVFRDTGQRDGSFCPKERPPVPQEASAFLPGNALVPAEKCYSIHLNKQYSSQSDHADRTVMDKPLLVLPTALYCVNHSMITTTTTLPEYGRLLGIIFNPEAYVNKTISSRLRLFIIRIPLMLSISMHIKASAHLPYL